MAFLDVVEGCIDDTVGGFFISAEYMHSMNSIRYSECKIFQITKPQIVQPGESIIWKTNVADGGFSYEQIPQSLEDLILKNDLMKSDILYSRNNRCNKRDMKNEQLFSLMLPMLVCENESGDFLKEEVAIDLSIHSVI